MQHTLSTDGALLTLNQQEMTIVRSSGEADLCCRAPLLSLATVRYADVASQWEARSWNVLAPEQVEIVEEQAVLHLLFQRFGGKRITLRLTITVEQEAFVFQAQVQNADSGVIVGVEAPLLCGFADHEAALLYLPDRSGQRIPFPFHAFEALRIFPYPVPLSCQLVTLNTGTEGWFLACYDQALQYKQLCIGGALRQVSFVQYPFVESGQTCSLAPVLFRLYVGSWHVAADQYRAWFTSWAQPPTVSSLVRALPIINHVTIRARPVEDAVLHDITKDQETRTYEAAIEHVMRHRAAGVEGIHTVGWHDRGHDTDLPEYAPSEEMGGRGGLGAYAQIVKSADMQLGYYLNGRLANVTSPCYQQHPGWALRPSEEPLDQRLAHERYGDEHFDVICPCAEGFTEQLMGRIVDLIENFAADFVQLDQIGAADSLLCFDSTHGHRTPATAWNEGYTRMLTRIRRVGRARHEGFWLWIEGAWEGAGQYADLSQGGYWPVHSTTQRFDELYRYTFPAHLMMQTAFLGGVPFWQSGLANPAVQYLKRYQQFFAISRFMDRVGLSWEAPEISAKWHLAEKQALVIARNQSGDAICTTLSLTHPFCSDSTVSLTCTWLSSEQSVAAQFRDGALHLPITLAPGSYDGCFLSWQE